MPYPALPLTHGGRVRAYRLAAGLARAGAEVELVAPWVPGLPRRPFERDGVTIRPSILVANALPRLLGDRFVPPLLQLSWQPPTPRVRRLLRAAARFDLVEFHFCARPGWMHALAGSTRVVYSAHNVEYDFARSHPGSRIHRRLAGRVRALEQRAVLASDLVVCCTDRDRDRMLELYGPAEVAVVPNGFDDGLVAGPWPSRERARKELGLAPDELAIVFVGGLAKHNRCAVEWLERELLPRFLRPVRLLVAGACAPRGVRERTVALGYVEDLRFVLAAADVAANPVLTGSGSNIKLAEYVAAGLPVVTTAFGLRGYEQFADLVTVADPDAFAEAIEAQPPPAGPRSELAQLGWTALGEKLHGLYRRLLETRSTSNEA